ncbi:MAG: gfo/Idh/MocA family oxidoreductase, partial [Acidimicrobiia bacterium]
LSWGDGITGSVFSSMVGSDRYRGAGLVVEADHGTMRVDNPLAPQNGSTLTIETTDVLDVLPIEASSTYFHQLSAFRDAVVDGTPIPTGPDEAVANMEVIDSCYRAAGLAPRPTHVED